MKKNIKKETKPKDNLVGKWFHGFKNERLMIHGRVNSRLAGGFYLVDICEFLIGAFYGYKVVHLKDMKEWIFYFDEGDWGRIGGEIQEREIRFEQEKDKQKKGD